MNEIEVMEFLTNIGKAAKEASMTVSHLGQLKKNKVLVDAANLLRKYTDDILSANAQDLQKAKEENMPEGLQDRLKLTAERIDAMAAGLEEIALLPDPIGNVDKMWKRPNGLTIGQKRVPLGVVGVIYEARPNVTSDVFGLCFKTGNVVILKGGSAALHSNDEITKVLKLALEENALNPNAVQLIGESDRSVTTQFMKMNDYIDVLIPRGGAGLIRSVVDHATIPVIETGTGNCHIYVDEDADLLMAVNIIENAKTQRIGVCNACESLVIHEKVLVKFMPLLEERLSKHHVEIRADKEAAKYLKSCTDASEEDFYKEYLDYIISVKTVQDIDEAIRHINLHNTGHSEAIITNNYSNSEKFLEEIDAACVYVNASTRFTDGNEFGFGAEIGISTQKLHARGPMGLQALTTTKYIIYGNGQLRE